MLTQTERRQSTRFRPKDGTMVVNNHALGPVMNISMGGLSFRYMGEDTAKKITDKLGIFLGSENILIDKLPTKVVSDKLVSKGSSFLKTSTRECSIQFLDLTKTQREKLINFISNKTVEMY
ncbi:MAG TPA: PilZ domain-containing protein [Desulfobacterales bacterium]|nr:PilZ domain-containing protein [Desulfobacterales bacterium]